MYVHVCCQRTMIWIKVFLSPSNRLIKFSASCSSFEALKDDFESNATHVNRCDCNIMCNGRDVESFCGFSLCMRDALSVHQRHNASNASNVFFYCFCLLHVFITLNFCFFLYLQVRRKYNSLQINIKVIKVTSFLFKYFFNV